MPFDDDVRDATATMECPICHQPLPDAEDTASCPGCAADLTVFAPMPMPTKPGWRARRRPRVRKSWKGGGTRE